MNEIQDIFVWYNKFSGKSINVVGMNKNFTIDLDNNALPHLLGLQYINKGNSIKGRRLYNYINKIYDADENIYKRISENNPKMLDNVKERVSNFKSFLENLHLAKIYEITNVNSKIKSEFLGVDINENNYRMLGIASSSYQDYLETFLVRKDNLYFKNSTIEDPIISIREVLDDGEEKLFSFDEDRQLKLDKMNEFTNVEEHRELIKCTELFEQDGAFLFENFKYYPVRALTEEEKNMNLFEFGNYLFEDGLTNINNKSSRIDDFYSAVPDEYKWCDLFYNDTTQSLYFISESGMKGYSKYRGEDLINELKTCFDMHKKRETEISFKLEMLEYNDKANKNRKNILNNLKDNIER